MSVHDELPVEDEIETVEIDETGDDEAAAAEDGEEDGEDEAEDAEAADAEDA